MPSCVVESLLVALRNLSSENSTVLTPGFALLKHIEAAGGFIGHRDTHHRSGVMYVLSEITRYLSRSLLNNPVQSCKFNG